MIEDALFLLASFLAAICSTVAGFGSSTLLMPVAAIMMDIRTGLFLVACFHLFNNLFKIRLFWNKIDIRIFSLFGVPSIIFAYVGANLVISMPVQLVTKLLAVFLIVFSLISLFQNSIHIKPTFVSAIAGGGLSGLLAGLIGLGGALRSTFLIAFALPKEVYVGTAAMIAFVVDVTRIPTYMVNDIVQDKTSYMLLPLLLVSALAGVKIGKYLLLRISQNSFRRIVLVSLLLVGLMLLFNQHIK